MTTELKCTKQFRYSQLAEKAWKQGDRWRVLWCCGEGEYEFAWHVWNHWRRLQHRFERKADAL